MKNILYILAVTIIFSTDLTGQIGRLALSPMQKIEQRVALTDITIVYSRPSMRGRAIFGDLVPYDKLWRTGANRNTTVEFSQDVIIDEKRVKKGKYAIFSIPTEKDWTIIFYSKTDNWNVPENIDSSAIVAIIDVPSTLISKPKEVFSIAVGDFTNYDLNIDISWDRTSVSIPIKLITREVMDKRISNTLHGPRYEDYYAASEYEMESGGDHEKGLEYINKGITMTDEITWWDLRLKAIHLTQLGRMREAKETAEKGMTMAKAANRTYGIKQFNEILQKFK